MDDTHVDIAVRWSEAGQNIPAKTEAELRRLAGAAGEAGPAVGDRMATAFARLEAREPTMVLRRTRMAIEEMAVSAVGVTGPLGRVAASFGLLAGPLGIGALLAVGAGGAIWHAIEAEADRAADNVEAAAKRMHDAMTKAVGEGFGPERRDLFEQRIAETQAQLAQIEASAVPSPVVKNVYTPYGYSSTVDTGAADARQKQIDNLKTLLGQLTASIAELDRESEKAAEAGLRKLREEFSGINVEVARWIAQPFNVGTLQGLKVPSLAQLQLDEIGRQVNLAGDKKAVDAIGISLLGVGRGETGGFLRPERADHNDERNAERLAMAIGREIGPLISLGAGIGRGSSGQAALAGLGAIGGTLSSLHHTVDGKEMALLGKAAPYVSLASGVLSGLSSIFGGGQKPKVIITAFEEEAARQIKELRSDPATTQFIIIGSTDIRSTQQALARLNRMGVISRLPR